MQNRPTRDEIFDRVRTTMQELFEVAPERIQLETKLIEDLELDSIDAIDLAARLEEMTRHRLSEDALRTLRTVDDVVTLIHDGMSSGQLVPAQDLAPSTRGPEE